MFRILVLLLLFFCILTGYAWAQAPTPRLIGGAGDETGTGMCLTPDSGYALCGRETQGGNTNGVVMYLDKRQNLLWSRVAAVGAESHLIGVEADRSGIYACGVTRVNGRFHVLFVKLRYDGTLVRHRVLDVGDMYPAMRYLRRLKDGGFAMSAFTAGGVNSFILKTDSAFNPAWIKRFEGTQEYSQVRGISVARDGGILFHGSYRDGGSSDMFFGKLALNGELRWIRRHTSTGGEIAGGVWETADGKLIGIGYDANIRDAIIYKTDSVGSIYWSKKYDAFTTQDVYHDMEILPDGNILVEGFVDKAGDPSYPVYMVAVYNPVDGNLIMDRWVSGPYRFGTGSGQMIVRQDSMVSVVGGTNYSPFNQGYDFVMTTLSLRGNTCDARPMLPVTLSDYPIGALGANPETVTAATVPSVNAAIQVTAASYCNRNLCTGETAAVDMLRPTARFCGQRYLIRPDNFPGATAYRWNTGATTDTLAVTQPGKYVLTVTTPCGAFKDSVQVDLVDFQVATSPRDSGQVCAGNGIRLDALGPLVGNYTWSGSPDLTAQGRNAVLTTQDMGPNPVRVVITLEAQDTGRVCPVQRFQIPVHVNPRAVVPAISPAGPLAICQGDSIALRATPADSLEWNTGQRGDSIVVRSSGVYSVRAHNRFGCSSEYSAGVNVGINNPPSVPIVVALGPTTFCQGGSVWLVGASFSDIITWNTGVRNDSLLVTEPGTYYATASYSTGCTSDTSRHVAVIVHPIPPTPAIAASRPLIFCEGDSVVLYARGAAPDTVVWNTGQRGDSIVVRQSGPYSVHTASRFGCQGGVSGPVHVMVTPKPFLATTADAMICGVDSVVMRMQIGLTANLETFWLNAQGDSIGTGLSYLFRANNVEGVEEERLFIAKVNVMNLNCATLDTIRIRINPSPLARAGRDTALCEGQSAALGTAPSSPNASFLYEWSPRENLDDATAAQPRVTNRLNEPRLVAYQLRKYHPITGCQATDEVRVQFSVPTRKAMEPLELCSGDTAVLEGQASAIPEYVFSWSPSRWLSDSNRPRPVIRPEVPDGSPTRSFVYYFRTYWMGSDCALVQDSLLVTVHSRYERRPDGMPYCEEAPLVVPNIITPNSDGANESFHVQGLEHYPQSRLQVFNRWGRRVYGAEPYRNDWKQAEAGMYFYQLEVGKRIFTGWVEVVK